MFDGSGTADVRRIQAVGGTVYYPPSAKVELREHWGLDADGLGIEPL